MINSKLVLNQRPFGKVNDNTWKLQDEEIRNLADGEFLIEIKYISLDPAMRGWLDDRPSYLPPVKIGEVMRAGTIGKVIQSKNENFKEGDWAVGWNGVQKYAVSDGTQVFNVGEPSLPPAKYISVLGMPGYTAYFGLLDIGKPKEGESIVVSGAAGAVGSVVGQIAKIKGLNVIGIAGGPEKCQYVKEELGFDECVDYKDESFVKNFIHATNKGIDIYFDNVGGNILDLCLARLNFKARVVICGAISQYNNTSPVQGPKNYLSLLVNRASMEGFVVIDYAKRYQEAAMEMAQWMGKGKLRSKEDIYKGIENFPEVFDKLFSGKKMGKLILEV